MRTVSDLERAGAALRVTCINCGHAVSFKARLLARRLGGGTLLTAAKFRCTKCERNNVRLGIAAPETATLPQLARTVAFGGHYAKFDD